MTYASPSSPLQTEATAAPTATSATATPSTAPGAVSVGEGKRVGRLSVLCRGTVLCRETPTPCCLHSSRLRWLRLVCCLSKGWLAGVHHSSPDLLPTAAAAADDNCCGNPCHPGCWNSDQCHDDNGCGKNCNCPEKQACVNGNKPCCWEGPEVSKGWEPSRGRAEGWQMRKLAMEPNSSCNRQVNNLLQAYGILTCALLHSERRRVQEGGLVHRGRQLLQRV